MKKLGVFRVKKKTLLSLPCSLNIETPSLVFSRGFPELLIGIPLSDTFKINIFYLINLSKCSISSSPLWFFKKDVQYFPNVNIHSYNKNSPSPNYLPSTPPRAEDTMNILNILEHTLWNSQPRPLDTLLTSIVLPLSLDFFLLCCQPRRSITNLDSNIISNTKLFRP